MVRFDRRVFGPGPLRSPGSRVLLAIPGVDYSDAEAAHIRARAINLDGPGPAAAVPVAPVEPARDEHGLINRGNGWYELPDGERVRGRAKAIEAATQFFDDEVREDPGDGIVKTAIEVPLGETGVLDGDLDVDPNGLQALGGDWWQLPNGERVHGRDAAEEALAGLEEV